MKSVTGNITLTHQRSLRSLFWFDLQHTKGTPLRIGSQNTRHMAQIKLNYELP